MDQNLLLTVEKLFLNADLLRGCVSNRAFVIKNVPAQTYLTVSVEQAEVLQVFAGGSTVPAAFAQLLEGRGCLPLREFYELVVKAYDAGVLCAGTIRKPVRTTLRWPALKADFLLWPAVAMAAVALGWLVWRCPPLPETAVALAAGLAVALGMLSAGQMLSASLLAGAGGEVYAGRRLEALARLHLRFDLRDARLLPLREQALVALAGNVPLTAALLIVLGKFPQASVPVAAVWLLAWRPWGAGLPRRLAGLWSRYPHLDTDTRFMFSANQRPQLHWKPWWRRWDWRVCAAELAWATAWTLLVARLVMGEMGVSLIDVAEDWSYWSVSLPALASSLLVTVMVIMMRRWRDGLRQMVRTVRERARTGWRRWRKEPVFPDTEAALLRLTAGHPLLGLLNPYDQTLIIRSWRPVLYPAWSLLAKEGEQKDHVGMILSGRAAATRVGKSGRQLKALQLEEGDFFGLPSLREGRDAALRVRSRTPVAAFMMPTELFRSVVMGGLGADTVYDLTHKYSFLRRLPLCAHWHPHAVARFSRLAQVTAYADGDHVLHEKGEARWFYIVYDGTVQVRKGGKLVSRLKAGDFFGEISLLQNSTVVADVVAHGQLRCLQIDRTSFLRFMTHNHHVALQLEKISSRRLGRPIFPLLPGSFEAAGRS
jgi:CRP-like cAMP-binding protein